MNASAALGLVRTATLGLALLGGVPSLAGSARDEVRRSLWLGIKPDTAHVVALMTEASWDDSVLVASALLAWRDTAEAARWHPQRPETGAVGELVQARGLLVRHATGEDVTGPLLALWRTAGDRRVGRVCAMAALAQCPLESTLAVAAEVGGWPRGPRAEAWVRLATRWGKSGLAQEADSLLWLAVETRVAPWAGVAAESLSSRGRPLSARERRVLGEAFISSGRPGKALQVLRRGASPKEDLLVARALVATGRYGEAETLLWALSATSVGDEALWQLATLCKRTDRDSLAARLFARLAERFPGSGRAREAGWEEGWAWERVGRFAEAGAAYRESVRRWPRGPHADNCRFRWGLAAWRQGDPQEARSRWLEAWSGLRDHRAKAAVAYWIGKGYLLEGEVEQAFSWWEKARRLSPNSFYGVSAAQRLSTQTIRGVRGRVVVPPRPSEPLAWVEGWGGDSQPPPALERAVRLSRLGFAEEARGAFMEAASESRSPRALARVLAEAMVHEAWDAVAVAAQRLQEVAEASGREVPPGLVRLTVPIPFPTLLFRHAQASGLSVCAVSALIRQESFYRPSAVSPAGAQGLMQLMPATALATAARWGIHLEDGLQAVPTNLALGCLHLGELVREFSWWPAALAAYNAGSAAARRWVARRPVDPELWIESITYGETRNYVKSVLGLWWRARGVWGCDGSGSG